MVVVVVVVELSDAIVVGFGRSWFAELRNELRKAVIYVPMFREVVNEDIYRDAGGI